MEYDFITFIRDHLNKRDWSQNRLARESGLSSGMLSTMMNGGRVSADSARAIAGAFKLPEAEVFIIAGIMNAPPDYSAALDEWTSLFEKLGDEDRQELLQIARIKIEKGKKRGKQKA